MNIVRYMDDEQYKIKPQQTLRGFILAIIFDETELKRKDLNEITEEN